MQAPWRLAFRRAFQCDSVAIGRGQQQAAVHPVVPWSLHVHDVVEAMVIADGDRDVDVSHADLPCEHTRWVVVREGLLNAEVHRLRAEGDEVRVLGTLVDDGETERLVETSLARQVPYVEYGRELRELDLPLLVQTRLPGSQRCGALRLTFADCQIVLTLIGMCGRVPVALSL